MIKKFNRTNIFVLDEDLWAWAIYKAKSLGKGSVSEYLFELIERDRKAAQA